MRSCEQQTMKRTDGKVYQATVVAPLQRQIQVLCHINSLTSDCHQLVLPSILVTVLSYEDHRYELCCALHFQRSKLLKIIFFHFKVEYRVLVSTITFFSVDLYTAVPFHSAFATLSFNLFKYKGITYIKRHLY